VLTRHIQDDEESGGIPVDIAHNEMVEGQLNTLITRRDTQRLQTEGDRAAEEGTS
jgi:DNA-directed RNA polymerase subunit K/omega